MGPPRFNKRRSLVHIVEGRQPCAHSLIDQRIPAGSPIKQGAHTETKEQRNTPRGGLRANIAAGLCFGFHASEDLVVKSG